MILEEVRRKHKDASHHCYAYRLGDDNNDFRSDDDGEPRGTAGAPILRQIDSFDLTDALVVVTRYYGGTKLGAGGLIRAYGKAARLALEDAELVETEKKKLYQVIHPYEQTAAVLSVLNKYNANEVAADYGEHTTLTVEVGLEKIEAFSIALLDAMKGQGRLVEL